MGPTQYQLALVPCLVAADQQQRAVDSCYLKDLQDKDSTSIVLCSDTSAPSSILWLLLGTLIRSFLTSRFMHVNKENISNYP